jgi:hypothetical protein
MLAPELGATGWDAKVDTEEQSEEQLCAWPRRGAVTALGRRHLEQTR